MASARLATFIRRTESDERLEPVVAQTRARFLDGVEARRSRSPFGQRTRPSCAPLPRLCADRLFHLRNDRRLGRPTRRRSDAYGAGVLRAVPTAATGLSDWADTADAERRVGFLHLAANTAAVSLYAASWWARRRGLDRRGQALGLAGATVMTAAGWLGGHLAYGMGVGVDTTAFEGGPTEWTEIARPETARAVERAPTASRAVLEDEEGQPRVLADRCTHRGGPLSEGQVADGCVTCPWHGSRFDLVDGHVVRGPATEPAPVDEVRVSEMAPRCAGTSRARFGGTRSDRAADLRGSEQRPE